MSTSRASADSHDSSKSDSPESDAALGPVSVPSKAGVETKRRIPIVSIPATISIGLLIAAVYLGGRILTARRAHSEVHAKITASAPPATPPLAALPRAAIIIEQTKTNTPIASAAPIAQVPPMAPTPNTGSISHAEPAPAKSALVDEETGEDLPRIEPQAGQRFIQVGALAADAVETRRFVRRLQSEKLDPHVAPGPSPELMRVLIGPFDSADTLKDTKARLETEGIDTFVRLY
jgi:cell division septation protein DedD